MLSRNILQKLCSRTLHTSSCRIRQDSDVIQSNPDYFSRVLERFPPGDTKTNEWPLAFAYGSGVFRQDGNVSKNNMTDFVLVVENSQEWHAQNIEKNPKDYAGKVFIFKEAYSLSIQ